MNAHAESALLLCQRLIALSVIFQSIELLSLRTAFVGPDAIWRSEVLRSDWRALPRPCAWLLGCVLEDRVFQGLLVAMTVSAVLALVPSAGVESWIAVPLGIMTLGTLLVAIRWRGSFNGGSDAMTLLVLVALLAARVFPSRAWVGEAALAYVAVQATLSYFLAGVRKAGSPGWWNGEALAGMLGSSGYDVPAVLRKLAALRWKGLLPASWAVLAFECLFPLAWLDPRACLAFLAVGAFFHLANAVVLGLNRFVWAWIATYPAVYFMVTRSY